MKKRRRKSLVWSVPVGDLRKIVSESLTYVNVLRYFGLSDQGSNGRTLKRRLDEERINYDHIKNASLSEKGFKSSPQKRDLQDLLRKGSSIRSKSLKLRLLREGLLIYKCYNSKCLITESWLGSPLTLQLDHVNGDRTDNRLENLRLLCPNCHSQTDTFGYSKKQVKLAPEVREVVKTFFVENHRERIEKGIEVYQKSITFICSVCSKEVKSRHSSKYCSLECFSIGTRKVKKRPSKEELQDLIDNNPMTTVGKMFGVSDNAIKKWCKKYGITVNKKWKPKNPNPVKFLKFPCEYCEKKFDLKENVVRERIKKEKRGPFCTKDCFEKYRRAYGKGYAPLYEIVCESLGYKIKI